MIMIERVSEWFKLISGTATAWVLIGSECLRTDDRRRLGFGMADFPLQTRLAFQVTVIVPQQ